MLKSPQQVSVQSNPSSFKKTKRTLKSLKNEFLTSYAPQSFKYAHSNLSSLKETKIVLKSLKIGVPHLICTSSSQVCPLKFFFYSKILREHSNHSKEEFLFSYAPQALKYVHSTFPSLKETKRALKSFKK